VTSEENSQSQTTAASASASETTKERSTIFDDGQDLEFDEALSDGEDAEIPEGSMFDYHIPGVLTKDEVKSLDLDHWRLVVRNNLVELEVSMSVTFAYQSHSLTEAQDIRGWEDWKIDDPDTIKGIAAELIAATGPKLLQNSALVLF
jgi:arginine-tRNA-protein transferase